MRLNSLAARLWLGVALVLLSLFSILILATFLGNRLTEDAAAEQLQQQEKLALASQWSELVELALVHISATVVSQDPVLAADFNPKAAAIAQRVTQVQKRLAELPLTDADKKQSEWIGETRKAILMSLGKIREAQKAGN